MSTIDPYIVKVTCDEFVGSGFLFSPKEDAQQIYIVSARHNFVDDNGLMKLAMKIDFWGKTHTYDLKESDNIYLGNNNEFEDFALIVLPSTILAEDIDLSKSPQPARIEIKKRTECLTSGFPKFTQNNLKRTLYQCQILNDKDYPDNLQVEVNDPVSHQYNSDDLVEGYSGSPIFITDSNQISILGLFSQYDEITRRISAISISFVNTLLERNGLSFLTIEQVEVDSRILADIKKIHGNGKRILDRIKNSIGDVHINRPDLETELEKIISKQALTVIYGKPGIGKSAFAKKVLSGLENFSLITLQGEQLDKVGINDIFKSPEIGISGDLNEILSSPALKKNKIIFIDSIEKLIETRYAETIIDFFSLLTERDDLRLVLTCRSYAVEHLKIRFLQQYNNLYPFEVPLLNDTELDRVSLKYGFLEPLLKNGSLRKILRIPFNIDKATLVQNAVLDGPLTSEFDFKQIMWEYVIEGKEREHDINRQQLRGKIFSEIAYKRAEQMVTYVEIQTKHQDILSDLEKDQLIEKDLFANGRYSASHDIYEDWALTRKIEAYYHNYQTDLVVNDFFYSVGFAPAFRRAFRIWISEKLQIIDFNIQDFIVCCLSDVNVEQHWKDELLIAIMQSPYSKKFLFDNKGVLFNDSLYLFKRCVLLLHVSCQSPDLSYLGLLSEKEKNTIYMSSWLKPYGEGWLNMIDFMLENLNDLNGEFKLVVKLVLTWGKSFVNRDIGDGAVSSGLILCRYFEYHLANLKEKNISLLSGDEKSSAIQMLFRLAKVIPDEVKSILNNCIENIDNNSDEDYYFWDDFKINVLSFNHSYHICELFPSLVLEIAEKEWFYYPPTEEELKERYSSSLLGYVGHRPSTEEQFGITDDRDYKYSPSSAYQTPVWHLLKYAPQLTLDFIINLFNHSVDAFFESDFNQSELFGKEERSIINLVVDSSTNIEVRGSELLWSIYRGKYKITSPHLLQSVLMALEKWLLEIATITESTNEDRKEIMTEKFEEIFKYLLIHSRSSSVHAVLISVATAHPKLCEMIVQPLLKVRQFYKWDLVRCGRERSKRYVSFDDPILVKKEREESDKMSHRNDEMEALIRNLSLTSERENIYKILDDFYAHDSLDEKWKLALNRMDLRKAKVVKATENMMMLVPEIDEELKSFVAEAEKKQNELRPVQIAGAWALNKWKGESIENDSYTEWRNHYTNVLKAPKDNETVRLFSNPGLLAAIGIRYFFDDLSKSEKKSCVEKIFYIVKKEIGNSHNPFNLESDENYSVFDTDPAFEILIDLVKKCKDN
ncbi:MAG: ATP-binding protein, partial [Chryseobacterium cucumeris]